MLKIKRTILDKIANLEETLSEARAENDHEYVEALEAELNYWEDKLIEVAQKHGAFD